MLAYFFPFFLSVGFVVVVVVVLFFGRSVLRVCHLSEQLQSMLVAARSGGGEIVGCIAVEVSACKGEVRRMPVHAQRDRDGEKGGEGGRTQLLLAIVIRPLTTHPFRDGA